MARILIIDDEVQLRTSLLRTLESEGHQVFAAGDGREGLRVFHEQHPDLVVTDLFMPEKDGLETIREIRRHSPASRIIAVSGGYRGGMVDLLPVARKLGVTLTLAKPFAPEELLGAVRFALDT